MVDVVVPSYKRPTELARCLAAIASQTIALNELIIVVRADDGETIALCDLWRHRLPLCLVQVAQPGQVQALNAGLARCVSEIVAITDDDAAPRPDWLERIQAHFAADPKLGGVGGRDWVHQHGRIETGPPASVGKVHWFGRITGNHHLGSGPARTVDILKGANCAFRMQAIGPIGFDPTLRGIGAQVHNDMVVSLAIKRAGWRLVYDPAIAVDHYPAPRFDNDGRDSFSPEATANRAYNLRVALRLITPRWKRYAAFIWHYLVGSRDEPGLLHLLRALSARQPNAWARFRATHNLDISQSDAP